MESIDIHVQRRIQNQRVERAAVAATEVSLTRLTELFLATPVVDQGVDLFVYGVDPFRVAQIQVKGATAGLAVYQQYSQSPIIVSYVLDPLGSADIILLTGEHAWDLPNEYIEYGGKAGDFGPDYRSYNWSARPTRLVEMLQPYRATRERWLELFELTATPPHPSSAANP
ncbi:hypothetical protein ACQP2U_22330 [Nocardia sp. CA-084685]|uniref:hypothetical protein n=1 Tax=Nocardia sp. CA-084685 TaxID=3239970 RepID=UPI003D95194D